MYKQIRLHWSVVISCDAVVPGSTPTSVTRVAPITVSMSIWPNEISLITISLDRDFNKLILNKKLYRYEKVRYIDFISELPISISISILNWIRINMFKPVLTGQTLN